MGQNGCRPGDLAVAVWDANPSAMTGEAPKPLADTSPGGGSRTATYPVADSPQARVNEGRTEERGPVIQRINRDLNLTHNFKRGSRTVPPKAVFYAAVQNVSRS